MEVFRPCNESGTLCCKTPNVSPPTFLGKFYLYECDNKCGFVPTLSFPIASPAQDIEGDCPYTVPASTVNVAPDLCKYYTTERRIDDYSMLRFTDFEGGCINYETWICDRIITRTLDNESGDCISVDSVGPEEGDCLGFSGAAHKVTWEYSNLITDCEYKLFDPDGLGYSNETSAVETLEYISRIGNTKQQSKTILEKINHAPTASCYLKVWVRARIQNWKIVPRDPPEIDGPEEGIPRGPCDGPFEIDGDPKDAEDIQEEINTATDELAASELNTENLIESGATEEEIAASQLVSDELSEKITKLESQKEAAIGFTYEWNGSGNPCYADQTKPYFDEENIIEGNIDWTFDIKTVEIATGVSGLFEMKYSIINGYEPLWPSERSGPDECAIDGYPAC